MKDYFTSDLHLNHKRCFCHRPFSSMEEMNDKIFKAFDCVSRGDRVFLLGDLGWDESIVRKLFEMLLDRKALIFWIEGNHDKDLFKKIEYPNLFKSQTFMVRGWGDYKPIFLSHYPQLIFDKSHQGAFQLHGHGHIDTIDAPILKSIDFGKRINVNIEMHDYRLWTRDEIEEAMKARPRNLDDILLNGTAFEKEQVIKLLSEISNLTDEMNEGMKN